MDELEFYNGQLTGAEIDSLPNGLYGIRILNATTNTTGSQIKNGKYFYLNGQLVRAIANIAANATLTEGTNYEVVTAGGLNDLAAKTALQINGSYVGNTGKTTITFPSVGRTGYLIFAGNKLFFAYFSGDTASTIAVTDMTTGSAVSDVTVVSGWEITIGGMPWYSNPKAIGPNNL